MVFALWFELKQWNLNWNILHKNIFQFRNRWSKAKAIEGTTTWTCICCNGYTNPTVWREKKFLVCVQHFLDLETKFRSRLRTSIRSMLFTLGFLRPSPWWTERQNINYKFSLIVSQLLAIIISDYILYTNSSLFFLTVTFVYYKTDLFIDKDNNYWTCTIN